MNKKIIAVTGKQGSGKSTFCNLLASKLNADVFNLDIFAHKVLNMEDVKNSLILKFGSDIISDNQIDRKKLGEIVFNNKSKLNFLNALVYKFMINDIDNAISNSNKTIILDYALLPLTKYWNMANYKILLTAAKSVRFNRLESRDKISKEYIEKREKFSINYNRKNCDLIFNNNTNKNLQENVAKICEIIKNTR